MYFGECLNNQIIYEFNFKEALSTLKNKIKQAILIFLDKLENWLKKGKDNKIKQFILGLVQKTRKLLIKVDNANTQDECKEVSDELNEYNKELSDGMKEFEKQLFESFKEFAEQGNFKRAREYCVEPACNYFSYNQFKFFINRTTQEYPSFFEKDDNSKFETTPTIENYQKIIQALMYSNFSKEKYQAAIKIGDIVIKDKNKTRGNGY